MPRSAVCGRSGTASDARPARVEGARHLALLVGEEVRVAEGHVRALVAQALGYGHGGEAHLYEQRYVTVAQVVDADALDVRALAAAVELVVELCLGEDEDALVLPDGKRAHPLLELVGEELGHHDGTDGLGRLWRRHHVAPVQALVGLRHLELRAREVEVSRREGQELARAQAAPVEHLEDVVASGLSDIASAKHRYSSRVQKSISPPLDEPIRAVFAQGLLLRP